MTDPNSKKQTIFKEESVENDTVEEVQATKTLSGVDEKLAGALCYLVWAITGIVFLIIEKENNFVRFHALQSIITSIILFVMTIVITNIPLMGWIPSLILTPVILLFWLFMMWQAYQGKRFKLPMIGEMVENQLMKADKE